MLLLVSLFSQLHPRWGQLSDLKIFVPVQVYASPQVYDTPASIIFLVLGITSLLIR